MRLDKPLGYDEKQIPKMELEVETLAVAGQMVYRRWAEEWDLLKKVKEEKYDGSKDWKQFHEHRLNHHTRLEALWRRHKDALVSVLAKLSESHNDRVEISALSPKE